MKDFPDQMVNFPETGDWRDSGEGGLWVTLVVRKPENHTYFACTDAHIVLSEPDVCVSPGRRNDLWEEFDYSPGSRRRQWDHVQHKLMTFDEFKGEKFNALRQFAVQASAPWHHSEEVLAAVQMGSTSLSLWSESLGRYFYATYDDLTPAGQSIYDGLKAAFGAAPELYTFLDT